MVYLFVRLKLSNQFKFDDPLFQMPMAFLERERERERVREKKFKKINLFGNFQTKEKFNYKVYMC